MVFFRTGFFAQDIVYRHNQTGFNVGGVFAFGSHVQRLGVCFNFFSANEHVQVNSELRLYFNFRNLGPALKYPEMVFTQGIVFAYGPKEAKWNPFLNPVSNQTGYLHSVGYAYNAWFNTVKTSQQTGVLSIQTERISFITENDILARPLLDRFRTGGFLIQYNYDSIAQFAINCTMWTGKLGNTIRDVPGFPGPGYVDTLGGKYTRCSSGLLSAQVKYQVAMSQIIQTNMGVDAEQIRNAIQNRVIHDVCFLPKTWFKRYNCHIPMLDTEENPFLYKEGQKIRKPKPFWQLSTNANLFY